MKKILISLIISAVVTLSVNAVDIKYKNLKEKSKISYNTELDKWSLKKNGEDYYVKTISVGSGSYSEFLNPDESFAFTTDCNYEFILNGDLIGYSNEKLKFYDFAIIDGELTKRELNQDEVQSLFPDYKIIKISEFSSSTNSLKLKKQGHPQKTIILNDTDKTFYHYSFTSGNSKFKTYPLSGFIDISKKGMIQFSHFGDNTQDNPWFILLVR